MLERLLQNTALQDTGGLFELSLVVVDNDADGSAKAVVEGFRGKSELEIAYGIEYERNIPAVRNHALRLARGNYIGIIDDDEFPPTHWLITLYKAINAFAVDGALGPVHPFFEQIPPSWLLKSGFCDRPTHLTGTILQWDQTRTGNVLLKREVFDRNDLLFDPNFKTGGSDREFFKQAMRRGCRFIAVEEAPVYEIVPPERWTKGYYFQRALVNGYNSYKNNRGLQRGFRRYVEPAKSLVATGLYALAVPVCACLGEHLLMNCVVRGGHHFSQLCAMLGIELVKKRDF